MISCDANNFYFYNDYIYAGRGTDGIGFSSEVSCPYSGGLRLTELIQETNRNMTADNWFSSVDLLEELSTRNVTYVGTVKKIKGKY